MYINILLYMFIDYYYLVCFYIVGYCCVSNYGF